jgi:L-ascorbate metabolism protein UlaG (beta-lactamase superfamily)
MPPRYADRAVDIPFSRVVRWQLDRLRRGVRKPKPEPAERVHRAMDKMDEIGPPSVTWIGHATTLIRMNGVNVLLDPNWHDASYFVKRMIRPGLRFHQLPPIHGVAVTHNHYDHLSMKTLRRLAGLRPQPLGIAPHGLGRYLRRAGFREVVELDWWDRTTVLAVELTLVPARHWSRRGLFDRNETLWGGFVVSGERRVWWSGDTALFPGMAEIGERCGPIDVALLPIGAYDPEWFMTEQHMTPEQAGEAFLLSGARALVPIHWGTFVLSDEPTTEPPRRLEAWWKGRSPADRDLRILRIGETLGL